MKQPPPPPLPLPLFFVLCFCTGQFTSGYPQPFARYLDESDIPKSEMSSSVLDICNSMFNRLKIDEDNQEIYKRFLFHYSRGQEPTYPHKSGKSEIAAAEFTTKDGLDALGRPFFLFRPRNGRTLDTGDK